MILCNTLCYTQLPDMRVIKDEMITMSFTGIWLRRRIVNKALFNYPRHVTPKYVAKSFVFGSLLSALFRRRR
jgi:hypothetical protein